MSKGERKIKGKCFLLNGRYSDREAAKQAADTRKADGYDVRIIKLGVLDYVLYEFPKDTEAS